MRKIFGVVALIAFAALPLAVSAGTVAASLVPDGTYTVKIEKVQDAQHIVVRMENGLETMLAAKGSVDFSKVKNNDTVRISVIAGRVPVYQIK